VRKKKKFKIDDREFIARELKMGEIAQITDGFEHQDTEINDIDMMFPDRIPSSALLLSLNMTREQIADYAPSEIEQMISEVEEVNPTFADLMQRLASVGRQVLAEKQSAEPSVD
jgi:hypothetical protein